MASKIGGIWKPYKELLSTVERAVYRKRPEFSHDLEVALKTFKPDFVSLLKNPVKNAKHRAEIKNAHTEGIEVRGREDKHKLPTQFIQEVLLISDILELNEYVCVGLLLAGEQQQPNFPGLTRGLVAVLLYYDGQCSLLSALRTLLQSRGGITWTLGLDADLCNVITKFTDDLRTEGLIANILHQLSELSVQTELDKLQRGQAIGDERHKQQLIDFITDQRQLLAECLFCFCCQSPLPKADSLGILSYLKTNSAAESNGTLDSVTLTVLMALLYCLNVDPLDNAAEMQCPFDEESLPILADETFIPEFHQAVLLEPQADPDSSAVPGLCATVQLAWALVLRSCSQWPDLVGTPLVLEDDEAVLDLAIEGNVFAFLRQCVIGAVNFHQEEYYVQRLHSLVTGLIMRMPLKVKELRNLGDEAARILQAHIQEGAEPSADLRRHFEEFMTMIGDLYDKDPCGLELATEFWCPPEPMATPFSPYAGMNVSAAHRQRATHKQVSLHKFVRLAGDLLPSTLFVPYVDMLAGLSNSPQAAHHCFNLLRATSNGALSWEHFFTSIKQYYMDLRQGRGFASGATPQRHSPAHYNITPEEQQGLEVVLRLIETVAAKDETARIALCDSQVWLPVASLFGLLSCPVPVGLKAQILRTLAALAQSPEIAASMWNTLEHSQVLQTSTPVGHAVPEGGIQVELDEIEARSETYPETRAFLKLLNALTDVPIPASLGAGYRAPGFEPYLTFLRDSVFLKFISRGYQDPHEKWKVGSEVLEVLFKLLDSYSPQAPDFVDQHVTVQGGETILVPKPPGFSLMVHMLNDTALLRMLLHIIDGASASLELATTATEGRGDLERTALLSLRMLEVTLEKQAQFMDMLRTVPQRSAVMATPLDQLIMMVNPQTQVADYLLKITRFLTHLHPSPELSLSVVKVLCLTCHSPSVQRHMVSVLTANQPESLRLLIGFVDHLEVSEPEDVEKDAQDIGAEYLDEKAFGVSQLRNATRQNILRLLLFSLNHPAPNLAHFLLGYELRKPVTRTTLQDPGVLGAARTCLHAVLDILNKGVDSHVGPTCLTESPKFAELAYQLINALSADPAASTPTLRYLRTSHDFLYRHLQHVPFTKLVAMETAEPAVPLTSLLSQQSWLLKTAAVELRLTSLGRQRSHAQRLLGLLFNEASSHLSLRALPDAVSRPFEGELSLVEGREGFHAVRPQRNKVLSLIESLDFSQEFPARLELSYFDTAVMEKAISACEQRSEHSGLLLCDVRALHRLLIAEVSGVQGTATAGQKNFLMQEVRQILQSVVQHNSAREALHVRFQALEAWRGCVEVVLASCPTDILPRATRLAVIMEILQELLMKITNEDALSELTAPTSGVILMLAAHLRQCVLPSEAPGSHIVSLDDTLGGRAPNLSSGPMMTILKGLVGVVLKCGGALQRVRANLYTALLYFIQAAQTSEGPHEKGVLGGVLSSQPWDTSVLSVLSSYGEPFMEAVCRDACDGHDVGRMLAFSLLDAVVQLDWQRRWLNFLSLRGFLRHMIEGLTKEDPNLQSALDPSPEPLKALYIYESKMALLARIAHTSEGAQVLLQSGLMSRLAECAFLDQRPEREQALGQVSSGYHGGELDMARDTFVPTVMERYRQLLTPALKVTLALVTSLGAQHQDASTKVFHFIVSHIDVFTSILQDRLTVHTAGSLQDLALTTGIVCNAGLVEPALLDNEAQRMQDQVALKGPLTRLQRLMIALLPGYCSADNWDKIIKSMTEQTDEDGHENRSSRFNLVSMETLTSLHQICANVIGYCRTVVNSAGPQSSLCQILFAPSVTEALARDGRIRREGHLMSAVSPHRPPSLGVLIGAIKDCADRLGQAAELHKQTRQRLEQVEELSGDEIRELISCQSVSSEKLPTQQKLQVVRKALTRIAGLKSQEIASLLYIVENCLLIFWRHLDFYFLRCLPSDEEHRVLSQPRSADSRMRRLQDVSFFGQRARSQSSVTEPAVTIGDGVTRSELEALKRDTSTCLSESLLKKLVEIEQNAGQGRTRVGFIQVLVRRIKRLLTIHGVPTLPDTRVSGSR